MGAMTLSSCNDLLDKQPSGQFTASQMGDDQIEGLLASAYAGLEAHFIGNNEAFSGPSTNWVFDVRSDDAYKGGGGLSMESNIHDLELAVIESTNPTNQYKWMNNYYAIARVHQAMRAINASSIEGKDALNGELRTLRAWYFFDLARIFAKMPYFDENEDPSYVRADVLTKDQIYDKIEEDLVAAIETLPVDSKSAGRVNKSVAAAIMCKVAAQRSKWNMVDNYSLMVMQSGKYSLYDNFGDMNKIEFNNTRESIFALQCSTAQDYMHINWSNLLNVTYSEGNLYGNGDDFFLASQDLVNAFATDADGLPYLDGNGPTVNVSHDMNVDPRLDYTVGRIGMPWKGKTHIYNDKWCRSYDLYGEYSGKKYLPSPDESCIADVRSFPYNTSPLNFIFIRYADILLLRAEALVELGSDLEGARELVNQVRDKAKRSINASYTPQDINPMAVSYSVGQYPKTKWTSQDYARKAVRMERRIELAMEGHRWFDLVRWGTAVSTMNAYYQKEGELRSYLKAGNLTEDELYLAIPYNEVINSNGLYE